MVLPWQDGAHEKDPGAPRLHFVGVRGLEGGDGGQGQGHSDKNTVNLFYKFTFEYGSNIYPVS